MKKMTFAVWFTALMAVFTFSSCLDSGDYNGERFGSEPVKVLGNLGTYEFLSNSGFTLVPTNMSAINIDISTRYAIITYRFNPEQLNQTTKRVPVTLTGIAPVESQHTYPTLEGMKEFANSPVRNITTQQSYTDFAVGFWDAKTMFMPITYFVKNVQTDEAVKEELKKHSFQIHYDMENEENDQYGMVFHVRHKVQDPEKNEERQSIYSTSIYEVNLNKSLSDYQGKFGKMPDVIKIEFEHNYTGIYNETQVQSKVVEVNYKQYLDKLKK